MNQPFVDIQIVQMIGDDDECILITSHSFTWSFYWDVRTTSGFFGKRLDLFR
jgi:hypothetical protein